MSVDAKLREYVEQALGVVDDQGTHGPRLLDDAGRLWRRIERFIAMRLVHEGLDREALELACYAMQLPSRRGKAGPTGSGPTRSTLRDRAEEAAELLVGIAGPDVDESLLDRATRILQEMPHRSPMLDEAKLLADAVNLEDFGVIGLLVPGDPARPRRRRRHPARRGLRQARAVRLLGRPPEGRLPLRSRPADRPAPARRTRDSSARCSPTS